MKTLRLAIATTMAAAFVVFAQTPAQAYPIESCSVSDHTVTGGDDVTVQVTVSPAEPNTDFEVTYQGQTETGTGTSFSAEFDTPSVNDETDTTVFASVTRDGQTVPCSGTITLLPEDDDDDDGDGDGDGDGGGLLPNTGGERLAWLIIGAMLVLVGGGVVLASRRRDA